MKEEPKQEKKGRLRKLWQDWGKPILVILVLLMSFRSAIADWNDVPTGSMKPTILEGDRIFVNKVAYDLKVPFLGWRIVSWGNPERGDVVVFTSPADGERLVKRVVGLPGDTVAMQNYQLWINGKPIGYQPLSKAIVDQIAIEERPFHQFAKEGIGEEGHGVMITPDANGMPSFGPVTVPAGRYFVMGDNRDNSLDSRYFGFVPRSAIEGEATGVAISFVPGKFLSPRWGRFFRKMD